MHRIQGRFGRRSLAASILIALAALATHVSAGVQEFEDEERPLWFDAASAKGTITTIDFTGFDEGTFITDQFQHLGVTFVDGDDYATFVPGGFINDDWGIDGNAAVHLLFENPVYGIALDFPGAAEVDLFLDDELVYDSTRFGGGGLGRFGGVVGIAFDEAVVIDWGDGFVFIDDIHFVSVPAPATLAILGFALAFRSRRRTMR